MERLRYGDLELIAFVHQTCGEFAAARHLAAIETDKARSLIRRELANPSSDEILDFATQTPLATTLAEMLMAEFEEAEPDLDILNRLLRILARPETSLSSTQRTSFLERLFVLVQSADRQKVYRAGLCLTKNDLSRLPEAEEMASGLLTAPAEWSRLVGWAILCRRFPDNLELGALEDTFDHFVMRSHDDDFFVLKDSVFGHFPDREVFEEFLIGALRHLLAGKDVHDQDRLIAVVSDTQKLSMGFLSRIDAVLEELDRRDAMRRLSRWDRLFTSTALSIDFAALSENIRRTLCDVISAAFVRALAEPPPETGLKFLSAFFRMSGMLDSPMSEITAFPSSGAQLAELHALFRAASAVFGLSVERLAAEAGCAIETIEALAVEGEATSVFKIFPVVDPPEVHWERAAGVRIDDDWLETLVHHRSGWVRRLAALLLDARLDKVQRVPVCERILATGEGAGLFWGAALAMARPSHGSADLVLRRIEGQPVGGLHHLFDLLLQDKLELVPTHLSVLERGLFEAGAKTAVSAARWCQGVAKGSDTWLVPLLVKAMEYWRENEDPYPVDGGSVPDSPREALLRTWCEVTNVDLDQLGDLSADTRLDVSIAAVDYLIAYAIESPDQRRQLVDMICAKRFPVRRCERLLDTRIPYTAAELSRMGRMRNDSDAAIRAFVVRRVFRHPRMDAQEAASSAALLKGDPNGNVRDAAFRFLDSTTREA